MEIAIYIFSCISFLAFGAVAMFLYIFVRSPELAPKKSAVEIFSDIQGNKARFEGKAEADLSDDEKQWVNFLNYNGTSKGQLELEKED